MIAAARSAMGGTAALAALQARLDADDRKAEAEALRLIDEARRERLIDRLHQWGETQRSGRERPAIDYARPRVVGSKPGSRMPGDEWYFALCEAIHRLPPPDAWALRQVYVCENWAGTERAISALLAMGLGEAEGDE